MKRFCKAFLSIALCAAVPAGCLLVPARVSAAAANVLAPDGKPVRNVSANNYTVHANPVTSYLSPQADGGFARVCATFEDTLPGEWYSADVAAPLGELTTADARRILRAAIGPEQL